MESKLGSEFCSFDEAATRLERTKRTIHSYVKGGLLRKTVRGGKPVLYCKDVEQLRVELGSDMPAITRGTIFEMTTRIRKLEEEVAVFRRIHGLKTEFSRPSKSEAEALFTAANRTLQNNSWTLEEVETWTDLLGRFDEESFELVESFLGGRSWEPFFRLTTALVDFLQAAGGYRQDIHLQSLVSRLEEIRKHLRQVVVCWVEVRKGGSNDALLAKLELGKESLVRKIAGRKI